MNSSVKENQDASHTYASAAAQKQPRSFIRDPGFIEYFITIVKIVHALTASVPALVLLYLQGSLNQISVGDILSFLIFYSAVTVFVFQAVGIYSEELFSNLFRFKITLYACVCSFGLLLFMHRGLNIFPLIDTKTLVIWFVISVSMFGAERLVLLALFRFWMKRGLFLKRTVILGCTDSGYYFSEYQRQNQDIRSGIIGFIDDRTDRITTAIEDLPLLGNTQDLEQLIRQGSVDRVLVALPWVAEGRIGGVIEHLKHLPVQVLLMPDIAAFKHARHRVMDVSGVPMFNVSELPLTGWSPLVKRCEDLVLCTLALLLLSPVMIVTAIAIKLDSRGPVLFLQKRYGYNNRLIWVYKFRSMYIEKSDADAENQTTRDDDRITRVGRFIRKTSIDELPQLFNVLVGNMSMVGPRPHATATKAAGVPFEEAVREYSSRHRVKPGITGWAQIKGFRGETDTLYKIEKRVEYDLEYIENWSVWLDLYILFRTVPAILSTKDVY